MDLPKLRERAQRFVALAAEEEYGRARGVGGESGKGALYRRHGALFDLDRISEVQLAVSESTGTEERRARMLLEFLVRGRAACAAWRELDQRITFQRVCTIQVGEGRIALRAVEADGGSSDPEIRRRIEPEYHDALYQEESTFQDLLTRRGAVYEELGYGDAVGAMEIVSGIDLRALARDAERFLADTGDLSRDLLGWHLPRLARVTPAEAIALDLRALRPPPEVERELAARPALRTLRELLEPAGLDLSAGGRLRVELRPELGDGSAAAYAPLGVPDPVVLLETPARGAAAHAAVLRALGCALHAAHTSPDLPVEYRCMGDPSVRLASGLLFEMLLHQEPFLRDAFHLRREQAEELRRFAGLQLLLRIRRDAALLRLAMEWSEGMPADEVRHRGSELLTDATGVRHDPGVTFDLLDLAPDLARPLRAAQLAVLLTHSLCDRFDEDWYRNPAAPPALLEMFAEGLHYNAAERGVQISSAPLGFEGVAGMVGG